MFVVVVGDLFSVIHAAEADFDCVTIKDFSYFVVFWEVLVSYGKESVSDIGAYIFVEWGGCTNVCCFVDCLFVC